MTVQPGEPIRIKADTWNKVERLVGPGEGAGLGAPSLLGPFAAGRDVIKVFNNTDTTFEIYEAVPISHPFLDTSPTVANPITGDCVPTFKVRDTLWGGLTATSGYDDRARFGIAQDRLLPGKTVDCVIGGWTWARLKRQSTQDRWFGPEASAADPGVLRGRKAGGPAEWLASVETYSPALPAVGETFLGVVQLTGWRPDLYLWNCNGGTLTTPLAWEVPPTGVFTPTGIGGNVPFSAWQNINVGGCFETIGDASVRVKRAGIYRVGGMATCSIGSTLVSGNDILRTYHIQWAVAQSSGAFVGSWGTHAHAATVAGEAPPWTSLVTNVLMIVENPPVDVSFVITSGTYFLCVLKQFSLYLEWIGHHRPG